MKIRAILGVCLWIVSSDAIRNIVSYDYGSVRPVPFYPGASVNQERVRSRYQNRVSSAIHKPPRQPETSDFRFPGHTDSVGDSVIFDAAADTSKSGHRRVTYPAAEYRPAHDTDQYELAESQSDHLVSPHREVRRLFHFGSRRRRRPNGHHRRRGGHYRGGYGGRRSYRPPIVVYEGSRPPVREYNRPSGSKFHHGRPHNSRGRRPHNRRQHGRPSKRRRRPVRGRPSGMYVRPGATGTYSDGGRRQATPIFLTSFHDFGDSKNKGGAQDNDVLFGNNGLKPSDGTGDWTPISLNGQISIVDSSGIKFFEAANHQTSGAGYKGGHQRYTYETDGHGNNGHKSDPKVHSGPQHGYDVVDYEHVQKNDKYDHNNKYGDKDSRYQSNGQEYGFYGQQYGQSNAGAFQDVHGSKALDSQKQHGDLAYGHSHDVKSVEKDTYGVPEKTSSQDYGHTSSGYQAVTGDGYGYQTKDRGTLQKGYVGNAQYSDSMSDYFAPGGQIKQAHAYGGQGYVKTGSSFGAGGQGHRTISQSSYGSGQGHQAISQSSYGSGQGHRAISQSSYGSGDSGGQYLTVGDGGQGHGDVSKSVSTSYVISGGGGGDATVGNFKDGDGYKMTAGDHASSAVTYTADQDGFVIGGGLTNRNVQQTYSKKIPEHRDVTNYDDAIRVVDDDDDEANRYQKLGRTDDDDYVERTITVDSEFTLPTNTKKEFVVIEEDPEATKKYFMSADIDTDTEHS